MRERRRNEGEREGKTQRDLKIGESAWNWDREEREELERNGKERERN